MNDPGPGLVGVTAGFNSRYTAFHACLTATPKLPGSGVWWGLGSDVVRACNEMAKATLEREDAQWMWMLGDDHVWNPDLLARLLQHDLPVVAPLVLQKQPPFMPVVFQTQLDDHGRYQRIDLNGKRGVTQVDAAGTAGMLVRREVLEAIKPPWFAIDMAMEFKSEDVYFCEQVRKAGHTVHVDLEAPMGHLFPASIAAAPDEDGNWMFHFDHNGGGLVLPMPEHVVSPHKWPPPLEQPHPCEHDWELQSAKWLRCRLCGDKRRRADRA